MTQPLASLDPRVWRSAIAAVLVAMAWVFTQPPPPASPRASPTRPAPISEAPPPVPEPAAPLPIGPEAARLANAQVPIADLAPTPAAPYRFAGDAAARLRARDCLAAASWYEAGDDPPGERAVIQVVLNRARHPAFPASVCAVVFQGAERSTGCQFTFACDGALARIPAPQALLRARAIAEAALSGAVDARVGLATHYHADYVVPRWRDGLVKIARQGAHVFYRWPGYWGSSVAMAHAAGPGDEPLEPALAALSPAHAPHTDAPPIALTIAAIAPRPPETSRAPQPATGTLELQLDPAAAPGSYALRALALCGKTEDCRVAGRITQDLAFLYVRRGSGEGAYEGTYWDCARFPRADRAQCLPGGGTLRRLLAGA